jgi:hypothetical protein
MPKNPFGNVRVIAWSVDYVLRAIAYNLAWPHKVTHTSVRVHQTATFGTGGRAAPTSVCNVANFFVVSFSVKGSALRVSFLLCPEATNSDNLQEDPLAAGGGGSWGGAVGAGAGGFGASPGQAAGGGYVQGAEEYDVVEIVDDQPAPARVAQNVPSTSTAVNYDFAMHNCARLTQLSRTCHCSNIPSILPFYSLARCSAIVCFVQGTGKLASAAASNKDVAAREAALAKREQEVKRREAALASRGAAGIDPMMIKNFPSCCPMVHHDIINDIPEYNKGIMRACASPLSPPHPAGHNAIYLVHSFMLHFQQTWMRRFGNPLAAVQSPATPLQDYLYIMRR